MNQDLDSKLIDVSNSHNLQSKKYDYVKIAYILHRINQPSSANQINYYFNRIFKNNYTNSHRIAQVVKQYHKIFDVSIDNHSRLYSFSGKIKLTKSTKINWNKKSKEFFTNPL